MAAQTKPKADSKRGQRNGDRKNGKAFANVKRQKQKGGAAGHTLKELEQRLYKQGIPVTEENLIKLRVELRKKKNDARRARAEKRKNEVASIPKSRPGSAPISKLLWG